MLALIVTTLIWSFSFSFIAVYLSGQVDNWFAVFIRVALAFLLFTPFLRWRNLALKPLLYCIMLGAIQLGVMYLFYYHAFNYLKVVELLLFTILTPVYVTLFYDLLQRKPIRKSYICTAILAVIGAAIIRYDSLSTDFWFGLLLIQMANICFAIGQVGYKRLMELYPIRQSTAFAWFYTGALIVTLVAWLLLGDKSKLPTNPTQWILLAWLGLGASGLGYFLWNYGATKVDAGTLAIMNNALIPAGILVNVLIWQQPIEWLRFLLGSGVILLSIWVHKYWGIKRG